MHAYVCKHSCTRHVTTHHIELTTSCTSTRTLHGIRRSGVSFALTRVVYSADAPVLVTCPEHEAQGGKLCLAYHKHYYGLGAHYNAVVPA